MLRSKSHRVTFYFILIILSFSSCYERQEGCLDISAGNYDFSADDPCADCCTYPTIKLSVKHEWLDTFLMDDLIYFNDMDQYIKIISSQFYISNIEFLKAGQSYLIEEVLEVEDKAGTNSSISNSFAFVQSSRVSYTVGTFRYPDTYDELRFTMGIPGNYVASDSTETFVEDITFLEEELCEHTNFRLEYVVDTISMDTLQMNLAGLDLTKVITLNQDFEIPLGTNFTIPIYANYQRLLRDIDFLRLEELEQKEKLLSNFDHFFSF